MDLIKLRIPAAFILSSLGCVSWRELQFGLANELIDREAIIDLAVEQLTLIDKPANALVQLAGASRYDSVDVLVEELASKEPEVSEADIRAKWLYLVLAWLYQERDTLADPLQAVEEVYADFGYPDAIASFVRYMPTDEPGLGSREANEQRLIERWSEYLSSAQFSRAGSRPDPG